MKDSMTSHMRGGFRAGVALAGLALSLAVPGLACAQDAAASDDDAPASKEDIIVTGTLIRGKAPVGSNALTLGANRIEETGAQGGNELLASVPQVTNYFNRVPVADLAIAVNQIQVSRPNIRNISPNNASSSATLILVDGRRIADNDLSGGQWSSFPLANVERIEIMRGGGSVMYGDGAVGGVGDHRRDQLVAGAEVVDEHSMAGADLVGQGPQTELGEAVPDDVVDLDVFLAEVARESVESAEPDTPLLWAQRCTLTSLSSASAQALEGRVLHAQPRYRTPGALATFTPEQRGGEIIAKLEFHTPQRALTPGQICALYDGDKLLGGAVFESIDY